MRKYHQFEYLTFKIYLNLAASTSISWIHHFYSPSHMPNLGWLNVEEKDFCMLLKDPCLVCTLSAFHKVLPYIYLGCSKVFHAFCSFLLFFPYLSYQTWIISLYIQSSFTDWVYFNYHFNFHLKFNISKQWCQWKWKIIFLFKACKTYK